MSAPTFTGYFVFAPNVDAQLCNACGKCAEACGTGALQLEEKEKIIVKRNRCRNCRVCVEVCSCNAVQVEILTERTFQDQVL